MVVAGKPVKLKYNNFCRLGRGWAPGKLPPPASRKPAKLDIFAQIAPFRRTSDAARRNIDEIGSLPYKPRQLSVMTRSKPGAAHLARKRPALGRPPPPDLSHSPPNCPASGERPLNRHY